ncbi:prolyl oligopeptidase family serine peptidase [Flavobacterium aquidurense]|uniref:prolyl oligopeptidase family serine peptidase n=1 Tax=Flavobacterium aquidurense TaxID=362413 RepID=UPI003719BF60
MKINNKRLVQVESFLSRITFLFFVLVTCPLLGQVKQKKMLQESDYHLWHTLQSENISENGNWISYKLVYPNGKDTLFVRNTKLDIQYVFPNSFNGSFNMEESFACITPIAGLQILNLKTGKSHTYAGITQYKYTKNKKYIITYSKAGDPSLEIKKSSGLTIMKIDNVREYKIAPQENAVMFTDGRCIGFITLTDKLEKTIIVEKSENPFFNLTWQSNGNAVAFLQKKDDLGENNLFFFSLKNNKLFEFDSEKFLNPKDDFTINPTVTTKLTISDDGQHVFFGIKKRDYNYSVIDSTQVQIWNASDKLLYSQREEIGQWDKVAKLGVWFPYENKFKQITSNQLPKVILAGNQKFAITFNPWQYETQYKQQGDIDLSLINLTSGDSSLILTKHSGNKNHTIISPEGNFITYFKGQNWWVYDISKKIHINCSANISQPLFDQNYNSAGEIPAYGILGWTKNDSSLLIYDQFDIWEVSPEGNSAKRLTHGREKNIQFRIAKQQYENFRTENYNGFYALEIDLDHALILQAKNNEKSGYYIWNKTDAEKPLVFNEMKNSYLMKSSKGERYVFQQQNYQNAPSIWFKKNKKSKAELIVQSNRQQKDYYWGKTEKIHYSNKNGTSLNGALFYPANYNPSNKYPLIVSIYELKSHELYQYVNPTLYSDTGFNVTNYTAQDYFVLCPDIIYEIGNPGISALDCVVSATQSVIDKGFIQKDKIGLIGHSFGGYETNFIITQTNLFAAAVSGAGVADLTSWYLTMGWNTGTPEIWRFENQQWRMGKSLFEDKQAYNRNSPLEFVQNIQTPLLSWTGKQDRQVHWYQSIEFYLALRRLQKEHILLVYPQEKHVVMNPKDQEDLSNHIKQWFDYYLQNKSLPSWVSYK